MVAALKKYLDACGTHKTSAGTHIVQPNEENICATIEAGYTLIALGLDNSLLHTVSSQVLATARAVAGKM